MQGGYVHSQWIPGTPDTSASRPAMITRGGVGVRHHSALDGASRAAAASSHPRAAPGGASVHQRALRRRGETVIRRGGRRACQAGQWGRRNGTLWRRGGGPPRGGTAPQARLARPRGGRRAEAPWPHITTVPARVANGRGEWPPRAAGGHHAGRIQYYSGGGAGGARPSTTIGSLSKRSSQKHTITSSAFRIHFYPAEWMDVRLLTSVEPFS